MSRRLVLAYAAMPRGVRALPPVLLMALLWWLSAQPAGDDPGTTLESLLHNGAHVVVYGALGMVWFLLLRRDSWSPRNAVGAVLLAGLYGAVDEWHQSLVPGRASSLADIGSDLFGASIGCAVLLLAMTGSRSAQRTLPWLLGGAVSTVALATWTAL